MAEFQKFPKIPRWNRQWIITEKIDGTNAAVVIEEHPLPQVADLTNVVAGVVVQAGKTFHVYAQSRNRFITPNSDNFGFAAWARENARDLVEHLGAGTHFGEWAGPGIQGNPYELEERKFFLFNVARWLDLEEHETKLHPELQDIGVTTVPLMHVVDDAKHLDHHVKISLQELRQYGSLVPDQVWGPNAEGIMIHSVAAGQTFKVLLENDEKPKSMVTTASEAEFAAEVARSA